MNASDADRLAWLEHWLDDGDAGRFFSRKELRAMHKEAEKLRNGEPEAVRKSKARKKRRAALQRQRVRNSLSKMAQAEIIERAMRFYEERNALSEQLRLAQFKRGYQP